MNELPRKPVNRRVAESPLESWDLLDDLIDDYLEPSPALTQAYSPVGVIEQPQVTPNPLDRQNPTPVLAPNTAGLSVAPPFSERDVSGPPSSKWKTMLDETVYFAGGLISHPFESTKHYSILRHSPALVYYKGPSTNVTISVFGDSVLPSDRSFWIQRKGFSGNIGMAASAFMRTTSNWIDVTPSTEVLASSVPGGDERAWQRDIKKFLKRASKDKRLSRHSIRETCVLRVPAAAADGYLRIVMCTGEDSKKSLCPSPTFRLASTSSDVSVLRGASLATLPLEVGLKAASIVGNQYVQRVVGPAQAAIQSKMSKIQPAFIQNNAGTIALAQTAVTEQFGSLEENFDPTQHATYNPFHEGGTPDEPPDIIGNDSGPEKPFPIRLDGKVVPGTGRSRTGPIANLANVAEDLLLRLGGIYVGWAAIEQNKITDEALHGWHEAIITIGPSPYAAPKVIPRKVATVHIIHDFGENMTFFNTRLTVLLMAFLRPAPKPIYSGSVPDTTAISRDREIAIASLSRERWQPDACLQILSTKKSQRSMTEKYVEMRSQVQKRVDSFPVHRAGIRTDRAEVKDEAYGQGGFYIRR
ncbi:hypothetical protein O1611_g336 [Lasiodiplodia mahajangana]|uniref:Uncharacterized protein n=1 Tax=Lasiodiplodia mahajangana TaxID=1108764 RepID=A0ACC2K0T2_9PEZI|nr:hypothetical protein O1611_g336 [Lasiodiplodia mahajangana]